MKKTQNALSSETPIDPPLSELLERRFGAEVIRPSPALIPNFGGFAGFLEGAARIEFYRFWVEELLDDDLVERFPLQAAYPDRIPPTLAFTEAFVNRHRGQPNSRAYLFALNLLAVYALGWTPERPLHPLGPWEAKSKRAARALEVLVFDILKKRIDKVARRAYVRYPTRDVEESDVCEQAYIVAAKLISGETLDEMAKHVATVDTWNRRNDPAADPLEFRLIQRLQETYKRTVRRDPTARVTGSESELRTLMNGAEQLIIVPMGGGLALMLRRTDSGYATFVVHQGEAMPPLDALRLVLMARRFKVDALESKTVSSGKSFWVHHDANLITHLFGSKGRQGRLYQELRDWLRRKTRSDWSLVELNESPVRRSFPPSDSLSEAEFDSINWSKLLPDRAATPLNLAIIKAREVHGLSGRPLRNFLADQGFQPPNAAALRQRWRYLLKLLTSGR